MRNIKNWLGYLLVILASYSIVVILLVVGGSFLAIHLNKYAIFYKLVNPHVPILTGLAFYAAIASVIIIIIGLCTKSWAVLRSGTWIFGFAGIGFIAFMIGVVFVVASILPGSPSSYPVRFPLTEGPLPEYVKAPLGNSKIGFDIYDNRKSGPLAGKRTRVPWEKRIDYLGSSQQNGLYYTQAPIWIEWKGELYVIADPDKTHELGPNRFFDLTKILTINTNREVYIRMIAPKVGIDDIFGPYALP